MLFDWFPWIGAVFVLIIGGGLAYGISWLYNQFAKRNKKEVM